MKPFAWTPAEGKPSTTSPASMRRAVDQRVAVDDADARRGEVELALAVHVRHLGGLAADQRDARRAADLRGALDQLRHLLELDPGGGDVVEQDEGVGAAGDDVVDAVRRHVGAAVAEQAAGAGDHRLRADGVGRGGEEPMLVERVEGGEGAEALAPVDSTAARSRSTTAPAVASETPAESYVGPSSPTRRVYGRRRSTVETSALSL